MQKNKKIIFLSLTICWLSFVSDINTKKSKICCKEGVTSELCFEKCEIQLNYQLISFKSNAKIDCSFKNTSKAEIKWYKNGEEIKKKKTIKYEFKKNILYIKSFDLNDKSKYKCVININSSTKIEHEVQLDTSDYYIKPPSFYKKEDLVSGLEESETHLNCDLESDLEEITNLVFYKLLPNSSFDYLQLTQLSRENYNTLCEKINISSNFKKEDTYEIVGKKLFIRNLKKSDLGVYICVAQNRYGCSIEILKLDFDKPHPLKIFLNLFFFSLLVLIIKLICILKLYFRCPKKKIIIEKEKNYFIKRKVVIDYVLPNGNIIFSNVPSGLTHLQEDTIESNTYKYWPGVIPKIDIIEERKEIIGKCDNLSQFNLNSFEIELDPKWEIDRKCLVLDKILGKGEFGVVIKGILYLDENKNDKNNFTKNVYVNDEIADQKNNKKKGIYKNSNFFTNNIINQFYNRNFSNSKNCTAFSNDYYGLCGSYTVLDFVKKENLKNSQMSNLNQDILSLKKGKIVAVKKLRENYNESDLKNFFSEMIMMKLYGNHQNIINLIGTCTQSEPIFVIMEYAEKGNLKDFLKKYAIQNNYLNSDNLNVKLTTRDLISFALQIAKGMNHLASCHCIHRDLAARNVLVTSDLTMKIADFGLSRNTGQSDYYRKSSNSSVPVKWLAPECIRYNLYTNQSDVWSYGVLLWEITSLGKSPYDLLLPKFVYQYLESGNRMEKPLWCKEEMYKLMLECWSWKAENRPSFDSLVTRLTDLLEQEVQPEYLIFEKGTIHTPPSSEDEQDNDDDNFEKLHNKNI